MNLSNCVLSTGLLDPDLPVLLHTWWDDRMPTVMEEPQAEVRVSHYSKDYSGVGPKTKAIIELIKTSDHPLTLTEISHALNRPGNRIAPVLVQLYRAGVIERNGRAGYFRYFRGSDESKTENLS